MNKEPNKISPKTSREPKPSREESAKLSAWLLSQRGRPQYRHAPHASRAVHKIIKPMSSKFGSGVSVIAQNWPEIAGARFAKFSRPLKITGNRDGRTLHIQAPGAAATLITAGSGQIIDRLNTFLGHGHISRIKLVQTAMTAKARHTTATKAKPRGLSPTQADELRAGLSKVDDPALKLALEQLGRRALSANKP